MPASESFHDNDKDGLKTCLIICLMIRMPKNMLNYMPKSVRQVVADEPIFLQTNKLLSHSFRHIIRHVCRHPYHFSIYDDE